MAYEDLAQIEAKMFAGAAQGPGRPMSLPNPPTPRPLTLTERVMQQDQRIAQLTAEFENLSNAFTKLIQVLSDQIGVSF